MVLRSSYRAISTLPTELSLQPQIQRLQVNFILFKTSFSHWKQKWINFYFSKWSIHCESSTVVTAQTVCPVWSNVVTIKGPSPCPWGALLRKAAAGRAEEVTRWHVIITIVKQTSVLTEEWAAGPVHRGWGPRREEQPQPRGILWLAQALEPSLCQANPGEFWMSQNDFCDCWVENRFLMGQEGCRPARKAWESYGALGTWGSGLCGSWRQRKGVWLYCVGEVEPAGFAKGLLGIL